MRIILETDIGRDPDDFFTLCLLISAGVEISAITISPGDSDQVALAKTILRRCGIPDGKIPVGVGILDRDKSSVKGLQEAFVRENGIPSDWKHDGFGPDLFDAVTGEKHVLAIGPLHSLGGYILRGGELESVTMQGGFVPYSAHEHPVMRLAKFEGREKVPTFNLNGDRKGAGALFSAAVKQRRLVSKNVTHTVLYDQTIHDRVLAKEKRAATPFVEFMRRFFEESGDHAQKVGAPEFLIDAERHLTGGYVKAFHDPLAAACMLDPTIGVWVKGQPYREKGEWGTRTTEGSDDCLIDLDRARFWDWVVEHA